MSTLYENPAFKLYALASTLIALQLIFLALWTGMVRVKHKLYVNPEDAKFSKGTEATDDHVTTLRVKRAHHNLLENAVPFFVVGLMFALIEPGRTAALAYFGTFVGARLLHTAFYLWGRQPFRTMMFGLGVLSVIGMAFHVVRFAMA